MANRPAAWPAGSSSVAAASLGVTQIVSYTMGLAEGSKVGKAPIAKESTIMSSDLNHEAYSMPVEELVNLWVTRYGNDWVDVAEIEADPFYRHAHTRLRSLGQLEQHYLTDRNKYVCRRPE